MTWDNESAIDIGPPAWALVVIALVVAALSLALQVAPVHAQEARQEFLRVTYYVLPGRMADGAMVHDGAAACSQWLPFGTILEFPDGRQVVCEDRGHGDWYWRGWVDVWSTDRAAGVVGVERAYGPYAWVTVLRWGWDQ